MGTLETLLLDGILTVFCPAVMEPGHGTALDGVTRQCTDISPRLLLLDMAKTRDIAPQIYRSFVQLHQVMKKSGTPMHAINVLQSLGYRLHSDGLSEVFAILPTRQDALAAVGIQPSTPAQASAKKPSLDVNFLNPFIQATVSVLQTQANTPTRIGKPHLRQKRDIDGIDIAAALDMSSKAFKGSIAICFPANVFLALYAGMVGETQTEITPEIQDAAGEILNMIFGQAKAELNAREDYQIEKAIPTILRAEQLQAFAASPAPGLTLPFETDHGPFLIEVTLDH